MFLSDTYKIAYRQLRRTRRRTFLTVLAVTISISFMVILISLGEGLKEVSLRRIATVSELSRVTVSSDFGNNNILTNQSITRLRSISGVRAAYPRILLSGKIEQTDEAGNQTLLEGGITALYPEDFAGLNFLRKIGDGFSNRNEPEIILSAGALHAFPGANAQDFLNKEITLTAEIPEFLFNNGAKIVTEKFKIVGFVETSDDSAQFYIPLPIAAAWTNGQYYSAVLEITGVKKLSEIAGRVEKMGFTAASLAGLVENIDNIFMMTQTILGFFGSVSLVVAIIGLINTMTIALLERTREIGIMKSVGASGPDIGKLFLIESAMIGFWGGAFGIGLGVLSGETLNFAARQAISSLGGEPIGQLFVAPWEILLIIFFSSIIFSVISGIYPAFQAARLNPAEALRYD